MAAQAQPLPQSEGFEFEDEIEDIDDETEEGEEETDQSESSDGNVVSNPFPHLREISSMAHWTVSSAKPGCGIQALLSPMIDQYWQSDGPQPHHLNIHFTKWMTIAHMRLYLDYIADESYTPTKMQVWAGTGYHDLQMLKEMELERPRGWITIDLSEAGGTSEFTEEDEIDASSTVVDAETSAVGRGSTLRCFLVQLRILENHQNGKDTHLRAFQLFAKDPDFARAQQRRILATTGALRANRGSTTKPTKTSETKSEFSREWAEQLMPEIPNGSWLDEPVIR